MKNTWKVLEGYFLPLVDVILPERTRAARIRGRSLVDFELVPTQHELLGQRIITLLDYRNTRVSDLIRALKYERSGKAAELCAEALADYLHEEISSLRAFSARRILLVPMPLHALRVRERGFNQMEKVLSHLPYEFKHGPLSQLSPTALMRIKSTPQQARLTRAERLKNVSDAFEASPDVKDVHVLLIDDVTTTGATLASAAKPLRKAGALVSLIALARA